MYPGRLSEFIILLLVLFFLTMGLVRILNPLTREESIRFTPHVILLCLAAVLLFARPMGRRDIFIFLSVAVLGFLIEAVGVNTGLVFGNYTYGATLGPGLFNTPFIIGANWLLMVYSSASMARIFRPGREPSTIFIATLLMLLCDIIIEPVAAGTGMWQFADATVPLHNYAGWTLVAFFLQVLIYRSGIDTRNTVAPLVLFFQFLFFLALRIFLR